MKTLAFQYSKFKYRIHGKYMKKSPKYTQIWETKSKCTYMKISQYIQVYTRSVFLNTSK